MKHKHSLAFLRACASWLLTIATIVLAFTAPVHAHDTLKLDVPKPNLAPTPPMGWSSWNKFACNVSEKLIREQADAMVASGMKDAGYQYINVDDCWQAKSRDADGNIQADPEHFPSGIKALADYVHSKGLKFGLYSDAGSLTCFGRPGSAGHEFTHQAEMLRLDEMKRGGKVREAQNLGRDRAKTVAPRFERRFVAHDPEAQFCGRR